MFRTVFVLVMTVVLGLVPSLSAQRPPTGGRSAAESLFALYRSGAFGEFESQARQVGDWKRLIADLNDRREKWPASTAAAFSLELAAVAANVGQNRLVFRPLVEAGCAYVRRAEPPVDSDAAVTWHLAALAVLQGHDDELPFGRQVRDTWVHFDHLEGLAREVTAIRFGLAIMQEQMVHFSDAGRGHAFRAPDILRTNSTTERTYRARELELLKVWRNRQIKDLIPRYTALLDDREASGEARLRLGVVQARQGDVQSALLALGQAAARSDDSWVQYLAHLFAGQTLLDVNRPVEASGAFENALHQYPGAAAALLGRSAALAMTGRSDDAARDALAALSAGAAADPYREYYFGQYRFWSTLRGRLREMTK